MWAELLSGNRDREGDSNSGRNWDRTGKDTQSNVVRSASSWVGLFLCFSMNSIEIEIENVYLELTPRTTKTTAKVSSTRG